MSLLDVNQLKTVFHTERGELTAVDGISFRLDLGETLGIVGESGSGKSVLALSLMRLLKKDQARIEGEALFAGQDLLRLSDAAMRKIRGGKISMIFQEPMTSLNPVFTVGYQLAEVFRIHRQAEPKEARERAIEALRRVKIPMPERRVDDYPHQMSGGMRQRVMIAMAMACEPELLIADEPTTALDVTIQSQILDLLAELKETAGMSLILITHDLGVVSEVCQRVMVMYSGQVVEEGPAAELFAAPRHPYTQGLLRARPRIGDSREELYAIPGFVPDLAHRPRACRFHPRCPRMTELCTTTTPALEGVTRRVACWHPVDGMNGG